jgi:hypothetical protein
MPKFEVVFEVEVEAKSAEHAATIARDMMLNPDIELNVDVHQVVYNEEVDDNIPDRDRGWYALFGPGRVKPIDCFKWNKTEV